MTDRITTTGRIASRIRMPLAALTMAAMAANLIVDTPAWFRLGTLGMFVVAAALYVRAGTPRGDPVDVTAPVEGRWIALNSPTSRVPSHGIHAWSQTYAVDLVADPADGSRPGFSWWPPARRPEDFPGFGAPIGAPISGTIVRARRALRDHWSRTSPLGIVYFVVESVRELLGPIGVLGNHVVVRGDDGRFALVAHLQRHSIGVDVGDRVRRGERIARCGNSGNSTEPHVHLQVMDRPSVWVAAGVPLRIDGTEPPPNGSPLHTHARRQ